MKLARHSFQLQAYLKHWLKSASRYNIHSPFVYQLIEEVFRDRHSYPELKKIERIRQQQKADQTTFRKTEFGAGNPGNLLKKVSNEARKISISEKYGEFLFRLIRYQQYSNILELGTGLGIGTGYLLKSLEKKEKSKLISMEGCPATLEIAAKYLKDLTKSNSNMDFQLFSGSFESELDEALSQFRELDLVLIDGNHQKEPVLEYFQRILPKVNSTGVIILDDIHWSPGMEEAWNEILSHPETTITIDLYQIGLVFLDKGLPKQHFRLIL